MMTNKIGNVYSYMREDTMLEVAAQLREEGYRVHTFLTNMKPYYRIEVVGYQYDNNTLHRDREDVLLFLVKQQRTRWTIEEISSALLWPEYAVKSILLSLEAQGVVISTIKNNVTYYSLIYREAHDDK